MKTSTRCQDRTYLARSMAKPFMPEKNPGREKFVVPGSKLGVIEEFTAGKGTYETDGAIYSHHVGLATTDTSKKAVSVVPKNDPILPAEGQNIIGQVTHAMEKIAVIDIVKIGNKLSPTPFTGVLHISASSPRYEKSMSEVCRTLDIVRAKVASTTDGIIRLMTVGDNLGVLKAYCSNCGYPLALRRRLLKCDRCNNTEKRKLADDYHS